MNEIQTPRTDAAIEADSYLYQILYPSQKDRPVRSSRMAQLEKELIEARERLADTEQGERQPERAGEPSDFAGAIRRMRDAEEQRNKLIEIYSEYVKLLGDELNEVVSLAASHGWTSSRVEQGKELRQKIENIKKEII